MKYSFFSRLGVSLKIYSAKPYHYEDISFIALDGENFHPHTIHGASSDAHNVWTTRTGA